ncbi:hypothetical protein [Bradyrhizobium japonicum]|jgi:hypothetical protein|uniref:hypothetical protein n=1 Tax=Bradyrhizobium japonicum TaxID=375 RepID=UPI0020A13067|nr:hypothetical protein [Bradyrhizobium japonicum]MCP1766040.1 hypothetical protein [Bradyrhizobium japonicum]MCP1788177.1 hypothetical protein [Bradyrhizobium japonicum]MCP1810053.1 hypothetical protein [Bradyrhizobium japonicum]MCP1818987.1 hypothetical protein [Bradyrhizobium japonicum]MCP1869503.1 hypothetical protein [Bradyrhizobium japonicum]
MFPAKPAALLLGLAVVTSALAHDDGRYDKTPLHSWFESLQSEFGKCCTDVDGYIVSDADWESNNGSYRVRIDNEWVNVPDGAVVKQPNRFGRTMVWRHYIDGHPRVRCFMPGSMT